MIVMTLLIFSHMITLNSVDGSKFMPQLKAADPKSLP